MRLKLRARLRHGSVRGRTPRRASGRTAPRRAALGSCDTGGLGPRMGPGRRAHRARSWPPRPPLALPDAGPRELSLCAGESGGWGMVPWILASKHFHSHTHTHTLTRLHSHAAGPLPGMPPPPPQLPGGGGHFINLEVSPGVSSSYIPDKFPSTDHACPLSPNEGSLLTAVNLS